MDKELSHYLESRYSILLSPIKDDLGGGWMALHPELEGCTSDGETIEEAIENLKDAKKEWMSFCLRKGLDIPTPKN